MKKITVLDFCNQVGAASDEIPVVVKAGPLTIGHFASLYMLPAASMPGTLEAKINFVTLKRDEIVIQITPKAYSTK